MHVVFVTKINWRAVSNRNRIAIFNQQLLCAYGPDILWFLLHRNATKLYDWQWIFQTVYSIPGLAFGYQNVQLADRQTRP